jgi:hypothetical protein
VKVSPASLRAGREDSQAARALRLRSGFDKRAKWNGLDDILRLPEDVKTLIRVD